MTKSKTSSLLMIGSFGFGKITYGGEDVKNRLLYKYLNNQGFDVSALDTSGWHGKALTIIWRNLHKTFTEKQNILLCSHAVGAVRVLPYLIIYKYIFKRKVTYMVVGFAINEYLNKYNILIKVLKNIDVIIVETEMHKNFLFSKGLTNVKHINNFRDINNEATKIINKTRNQQLKIIYFTRIDERKPIDRITEIMSHISNMNLDKKYRLNIYGKLHKDYEKRFYSKISDIKNIKYHGSIDANKIRNTMMNHDVMIYPISAKEDVFPGVLLDAFSGKLPVIAKNSNYVAEIIKDNINGFLVSSDHNAAWLDKLEQIRQMKDLDYQILSESTYNNALKFDTKHVLDDFIKLFIKEEVV